MIRILDNTDIRQTTGNDENAVMSQKATTEALNSVGQHLPYIISVAHRGYSITAPENTLVAYRLAKENGFDFAECDVSFTSDGVAVLLHDATIDRTSDGSGNIANLTFSEVRQYDFGSWKSSDYTGTKIPTFEEFIKLCKYIGLHPYIELKDSGTYTQEQILSLLDIVKQYRMQNDVTWISFKSGYLKYIVDADNTARVGLCVVEITDTTITTMRNLQTSMNRVFVDAYYPNVTDSVISLCRNAELPIELWTVNDETYIHSLHPYISGITSDSINARECLKEHYMAYDGDMSVVSISAVYSGGDVTVGTTATELTDIVVTATYSDGTSKVVTGYTLSGEIAEGENTITVTYAGVSTTFTVTGVAEIQESVTLLRDTSRSVTTLQAYDTRALYVSAEILSGVNPWKVSSDTITATHPDINKKTWYPIAVPSGSTKVIVTCPSTVKWGVTSYSIAKWNADGNYIADSGWQATGGGEYTLPETAELLYVLFQCNAGSDMLADDYDTSAYSFAFA